MNWAQEEWERRIEKLRHRHDWGALEVVMLFRMTRVAPTEIVVPPPVLRELQRRLGHYDRSMPTGVYDGKRWFRQHGPDLFMGEHVHEKDDDFLIIWRKVLIDEEWVVDDTEKRLA